MFSAYGSVPVYAAFFRWLGWAGQLDPMVEAYEAGDRQRAMELAPEELIRGSPSSAGPTRSMRDAGIRRRRRDHGRALADRLDPSRIGELLEALAPR